MRPGTLLFFPAKVRYIVLAAYRVVRYAREAAAAAASSSGPGRTAAVSS